MTVTSSNFVDNTSIASSQAPAQFAMSHNYITKSSFNVTLSNQFNNSNITNNNLLYGVVEPGMNADICVFLVLIITTCIQTNIHSKRENNIILSIYSDQLQTERDSPFSCIESDLNEHRSGQLLDRDAAARLQRRRKTTRPETSRITPFVTENRPVTTNHNTGKQNSQEV